MPDKKDKLEALRRHHGMMSGAQWAQARNQEEERRRAGTYEIERVVPGQIIENEAGSFFLVRRDFLLDYFQGDVELGAVLKTDSRHIAFSACDPDLADLDPRKTLFMDTETTGLSGGTGTVAFLTGIGYFTEDAFRLDQCFMRDFDEEEPMLRFLADMMPGFTAVVGYNSKSFDLPLLRTRFIQHRIPFRMDGFLHYDAMHAARRIWKERLGSCTLCAIEQQILGVRREGDVPGHLIPELWFDYLRSRDARSMRGVLYHHQMDILSLVALTGLVSLLLEAPEGQGFEHAEDRLSLVRIHFRQKHYPEVLEHARRFLETEEQSPLRRECLEMTALACKRLQQFADMASYFELIVQEFPSHIEARLELAKHHEHRTRDLNAAERLCTEALELLERHFSADDPGYNVVRKRIERIQKKRSRGRPGTGEAFLDD